MGCSKYQEFPLCELCCRIDWAFMGRQRIPCLGNNLPPSSFERPLISVSRDQIEGINVWHIRCELGTWKKIFFSIITLCDGGHLKNMKVRFDEKTQVMGSLKFSYCKVCMHLTSARMMWGSSNTGAGCLERLQGFHPWWSLCSSCPCLRKGVWTSLPWEAWGSYAIISNT